METQGSFPSVLGNPALDFANTGIDAMREPGRDVLGSIERFLAWCRHAGVITTEINGDREAQVSPPEERSFLHAASRLRTALSDIASAVAARREPEAASITELQTHYVEAIGHARGRADPGAGHALTWSWEHRPPAEHALAELTDAAVELFRHGALERLKACDDCRYAYLDASKNNSRRWCSMEGCGKTAKMRRYVERRAARRTGGSDDRNALSGAGGPTT